MSTRRGTLRDSSLQIPPKKKKEQISNYNKKQLLTMLKETNCHPKELKMMTKRFRIDDENIIKGMGVGEQSIHSSTVLNLIELFA